MENFAEQCIDMAHSILEHNLEYINEDGSISPVENESSPEEESAHAALAIGEFFRATKQTKINEYDLVDLSARCITAQAFTKSQNESGLAHAALGLLSFGPAKSRNLVWERLLDETRTMLDRRLLARTDYQGYLQSFNIAKSVARYSMGLSKKDETGKLIDRFVKRIQENSSNNYCSDYSEKGIGGVFDITGLLSFIFIRQSLQLHANVHLSEHKLPSLRTYAEKYINLLPDLVRCDGLGWAYGDKIGAFGQMYCISIILQGMRDNWINGEKKYIYIDVLRKLFHYFFASYLDQEHGYLVIRDQERTSNSSHTTRMANFDAVRHLSQWSRLAKKIGGTFNSNPIPIKTSGRYVIFDKSNKKEQGLFTYQHSNSGLHIQLPLVSSGGKVTSDYLPFPHCPGIFDWPANQYLPVLIPELTFRGKVTIPAYYGKNCVAGLGLRRSFYFRYEQPDLITNEEEIVPGIGSCKVSWNFSEGKVTSEFSYQVNEPITLDYMRYVVVIGAPHSKYHMGITLCLGGSKDLDIVIEKNDFQAQWQTPVTITNDHQYKSHYGQLHTLRTLERSHSLIMRPGQLYNLKVTFTPNVDLAN